MTIQQDNIFEALPWEYKAYQQLCDATSPSFTPAYLHGLAWSIFVTVGEKGLVQIPFFQKWMPDELALFKNLMAVSATQKEDPNVGIQLLLPEDEASMSHRLEALVDWCEGFLQGMQLAEASCVRVVNLPSVQEIIKDIEAISGLRCDEVSTEDNERYYIELVEFVRVAILLIEANINEPQDVFQEKVQIYH